MRDGGKVEEREGLNGGLRTTLTLSAVLCGLPKPCRVFRIVTPQAVPDPACQCWTWDRLFKLFESGATIVNVHSGQPNQQKVIEFYANNVLPKFRNRA